MPMRAILELFSLVWSKLLPINMFQMFPKAVLQPASHGRPPNSFLDMSSKVAHRCLPRLARRCPTHCWPLLAYGLFPPMSSRLCSTDVLQTSSLFCLPHCLQPYSRLLRTRYPQKVSRKRPPKLSCADEQHNDIKIPNICCAGKGSRAAKTRTHSNAHTYAPDREEITTPSGR